MLNVLNIGVIDGGKINMSHGGKFKKICKIRKDETCYNCSRKVSIVENKETINVVCYYCSTNRQIIFKRNLFPNPYCGAYMKKQ